MFVDSACKSFLRYCQFERQLSPHTLAAYKQDLDEFRRFFANRAVISIEGEELVSYTQRLSSSRHLAPASVKRRLACLRAMFVWLQRVPKIAADPFSTVNLRVRLPARLPRCLTGAEVKLLLTSADKASTVHIAVLLLITTGVRIGELAAIRVGDLDLDQRCIRIFGKGSRERKVFLPNDRLVANLRGYLSTRHQHGKGPNERLLVNARGLPASSACLRTQIKSLAQNARIGRRITPHMLRHTAATALMDAGVDIRLIQRLLGHKSIVTTEIYTHVSDTTLKAAIVAANVCQAIENSEADVR